MSANRSDRFRLAVGTSLVSKLLGALVQVATLPVLQQTLGTERLATYLAVTALVAWIAPLGMGVLPAMTRHLAVAASSGDHAREARLVGAGFWFTLLLGLALAALSVAFVLGLGAARLVGSYPDVASAEITRALLIALLLASAYFFGNCAAAIRAGYQQMHVSNLLSTAANLMTLAMLALLWRQPATIGWFVVAVYAPLTILMLADIVAILQKRTYLAPPPLPSVRDLREGELKGLLRTSGVAWIAQLHGFLVAHGSVLIVSNLGSAEETAAFGTLMRAVLLVYAVVGLYVWPLVPALADAVARQEWRWARQSWQRGMLATLAIALPAALFIAAFGPWLVRTWLGGDVAVPPLMALGTGLFLLGFNVNFLAFNLCLALGETRRLGWTYAAEAFLFLGLAALAAPTYGASGVAIALGAVSLAVNFWILPLRSWRRVSHLRAG